MRLHGLFIVSTLFALCACSAAPEGGVCPAIACRAGATLDTTLNIPGPASDQLTIRACRNDVCGTTTLQLESGGRATITPATTGPQVDLLIGNTTAAGAATSIQVHGESADMKDGDVYRITIDDVTSKTNLLDFTSTPTTYTINQPNGPGCGPGCRVAKLVSAVSR
ncbi:MAG: hypothetical protein ABI175_17695 [Polyangiales bacterium]